MLLGEYLDEHDLDYKDVILKTEDGRPIERPYGCLLQYCEVLEVNGNEIVVR